MENNEEKIKKMVLEVLEDARQNGSAKGYTTGQSPVTPISEPIQDSKPIVEPEKLENKSPKEANELAAHVNRLQQILNSPDSRSVGQNAHAKSVSATPIEIELNNSNVKEVENFNFRLLWERMKTVIIPLLIAAGIFHITLTGLEQIILHNNGYKDTQDFYNQQAYYESINEQLGVDDEDHIIRR